MPTSLVDDPATSFDETQCAPGNHGKTVSSVAQSVPPGPGHGEQVSEAAHSSCGQEAKADKADDESAGDAADVDEDVDEDVDDDESDDGAGKPARADKPQNPGNGNSNGNRSEESGNDSGSGKGRSGRDG